VRGVLALLDALDSACTQLKRYLWLVPRVERLELRVRLLEELSRPARTSDRQERSPPFPDSQT